MWFDVDWNALTQWVMPSWWRKPRFVAVIRVLISPVVQLHATMVALRGRLVYELSFTGQTMSMEHALNDRFDPVDRGIYIENQADLTQLYLYNKIEGQPPLYIYRKWRIDLAVGVGEFVAHGGSIWEAVNATTGSLPASDNPDWAFHKLFNPYLINQGEALQFWDFIVFVPVALGFNDAEMRALVNKYRQAGKRYTIQTY